MLCAGTDLEGRPAGDRTLGPAAGKGAPRGACHDHFVLLDELDVDEPDEESFVPVPLPRLLPLPRLEPEEPEEPEDPDRPVEPLEPDSPDIPEEPEEPDEPDRPLVLPVLIDPLPTDMSEVSDELRLERSERHLLKSSLNFL